MARYVPTSPLSRSQTVFAFTSVQTQVTLDLIVNIQNLFYMLNFFFHFIMRVSVENRPFVLIIYFLLLFGQEKRT